LLDVIHTKILYDPPYAEFGLGLSRFCLHRHQVLMMILAKWKP
jgi:hypothetical protein